MQRFAKPVTVMVVLMLAGFLSRQACAGQPGTEGHSRLEGTAVKPVDVALGANGGFKGMVVDAQGVALGNTEVLLVQGSQVMGRASSDAKGRFEFSGVRGGTYALTCGQSAGLYRLWTPAAAPPAAMSEAVIYTGNVIRGAHGKHVFGGFRFPSLHPIQWLHSPTAIGAIIATSIALPIALHDDEEGS